MPSDWLKIRLERPDLTNYVTHWTRGGFDQGSTTHVPPLEILKRILSCGFLLATFAPRRNQAGTVNNTIKGPHPAVCFSEQPLSSLIITIKNLPDRATPYGVTIHKWNLFQYGGRPVMYGDERQLDQLPDNEKYLGVRFSPIPNPAFGFPIDWTHEREWRARVVTYHYSIGMSPTEGVPLLLPDVFFDSQYSKSYYSYPAAIVKTDQEAEALRVWRSSIPTYTGTNGILRKYFNDVLPRLLVIPLDLVERKLLQGDNSWAKLDTLPLQEVDPSYPFARMETVM